MRPSKTIHEQIDFNGPRFDNLGPCWVWLGYLNDRGYGKVRRNNTNKYAHRVIYEMLKGKVTGDQEIDHLCRRRNCVNPAHLEPVTRKVNVLRGIGPTAINARKTHCIRGHSLSDDNLHVRPNGGRTCRLCRKMTNALNYQKRKSL